MKATKKEKKAHLKAVFVTRADLEGTYIGFSAAIEWIACRGKPMTFKKHFLLTDEAAIALIDELANLPKILAEAYAEGINCHQRELGHVPIPYGLWGSVGATEMLADDKTYQLSLLDEVSEWGGELTTSSGKAYTCLRLLSRFTLEFAEKTKLPSHTHGFADTIRPKQYSQTQAYTWLESAVIMAPPQLKPLLRYEIELLGRAKFPEVPRDKLREMAAKLAPNAKRGPSGKRNLHRNQTFAEFRGKVLSAELRN